MHRVGVGGGMHRDRLDAHLAAGADDAKGDLAAVGDQDLVEHRARPYSMIMRGAPYSTGVAVLDEDPLHVPARGAGIWFMVFIASMISTVWPSATLSPTLTKAAAPGSGER
jgi:hypothetical protein